MASRTGATRILSGVAGVFFIVAVTALAQVPPDATKSPLPNQADPTRQSVPINTVDGVELVGTFYRANVGRDTPCVIMVHKLGEDSSKTAWVALAMELRAAGFAVLTFDLRGHGKSTAVEPAKFWGYAANKGGFRGATTNLAKRNSIKQEEFRPNYLPMLVNDVLAARRFLEVKNDAGELNTNSIVVIGAQEGASLGLLFAATEFNRTYTVGSAPLLSPGTRHIAGEDIAAGVWLSMPLSTAQGTRFDANNWIRNHPAIRDKIPMCLVYGERDTKTKTDADTVMRALAVQGREKHKLDSRIEIKGTDLAGLALLSQPTLNVNSQIVAYVKRVLAERKAIPWSKVDPEVNRISLVNLRTFGFPLP